MASPDYRPLTLDLSIQRDKTTVVDVGTKINHVAVEEVPAGASAFFHIGNKEGIPLVQGEAWDIWATGPDGCPVPHDEGLFITNPVGGGNLRLVISFGDIGIVGR